MLRYRATGRFWQSSRLRARNDEVLCRHTPGSGKFILLVGDCVSLVLANDSNSACQITFLTDEYALGIGFVTKLGTMHPPDHFPPGSFPTNCCHGSIAVYIYLTVWNGAGTAVPVSG